MSPRFHRSSHDYELLPRASIDSHDFSHLERSSSNSSWLGRLTHTLPLVLPSVQHISKRSGYAQLITPWRRRRSLLRLIYRAVCLLPYVLILLVLFVSIFMPSYTRRPAHYDELRQLSLRSTFPGRANVRDEKVFIAASIYETNGTLTGGPWGKSVLELVNLLGPRNVYLSVYENNPDPVSRQSLVDFKRNVTYLPLDTLPRVTLPTGETRIKRIAFLAEVRNRALAPIDKVGVAFDRLLFINDVNFNPIEAAQLLFATNIDATGRANYGAACAVDFINPFKFYDRFATRDLDGYSMGIPFFPWFTSAGSSTSRADVIAGSDAIRVRSCWGGMTAFEAKWFQDSQPSLPQPQNITSSINTSPDTAPLRFRYEEDIFWDSSECCLVNADLQYRRTGQGMPADSGIYMNPFIRVAYDTTTLSWLSLTRRPERLYSIIHNILNHMVGLPMFNPRQTEEPGETVTDKVWEYDDPVTAFSGDATKDALRGEYKEVQRIASPASIICVDLMIRQLPGKKNFKIEDSNPFLSSGLSLSFGVMIFSSLYSMLPSARSYLQKGGLGPKQATLALIGCFLIGAIGISFLSRIIHRYIPHSVVDCDHDHGDEEEASKEPDQSENGHTHSYPTKKPMEELSPGIPSLDGTDPEGYRSYPTYGTVTQNENQPSQLQPPPRRPSLQQLSTKVSQLVTGSKEVCDENGQCFGYSNPGLIVVSTLHKTFQMLTRQGLLQDLDEQSPLMPTQSGPASIDHESEPHAEMNGHFHTPLHKQSSSRSLATQASAADSHEDHLHHSHHHHVPTNVFFSIGLQTSIAIALHKLPEGFITYATNHVNPRLGVAVFLALFIHNITEGFAMALPLYLAINSRWKAMFWSVLLGGLTQPAGAGIAALWFKVAGRGEDGNEPGETVYGVMFAVTAGIMAMVSLQLFSESLDLTHSRKLCFGFAFVGMGILGLSSALTA
ncbi:glycosyltransferase family 69 protein [Zopfia rhizophila CBS 207.26]|uniref:Glycosyltransferase family 69 protein n=1 Tax=Zopfia rhizophila CBS 207.26 TaxID=1314779 RepID=A0A6A6EKQ0_9PEZI|nr:glycosyltransferase family 69 protein [Zopfia rhizophila CBS 207.26]